MSLFKARDFWSTVVEGDGGNEEECDTGCLVIANIDNAVPSADKVIVGGFSGNLRVFLPQSHRNEEGEETYGFRPDHVLLETTLNYPIIRLAAGRFVSGNDLLHLCVLHPDRMAVYTVSVTTGQTGHGHHSRLSVAYQHKFQRQAHSLAIGSFGGVKGKDFIAVLSLDGIVTVYEQESYAFQSFLPGFLLPGPIAYVSKSDSIVTASSDWCLQCFKYQVLASATEKEKESSNSNNNSSAKGKRFAPEWTRQLNGEALDIIVMSPPEGPTNILVLTTRAIYCFKESGVLRFLKKLEYNPSSFMAYPVDNFIHICIGTYTSTLLVYKETELKWASQLPFPPVALARADFTGIKGAVVFLGDTGQLQVAYLGTDPSLFVAPPTETREINYNQTDKELAQLHRIIKASTKDTGTLVGGNRGDNDLLVSGSIGTQLERWLGSTKVQDPDGVPAVPVVVRLTAHIPLNCVRVNICVEKPLAVTQDTFVLRTICDTSQIMVKIYLAESYIPTSLKVSIIASYVSQTGAPRVITSTIEVPLRLVVRPNTPSKEADHKITIVTNKAAVNLPELFPDFGLDGNVTTALGLQYYGGPDITILSSRTTNRYRLQSDSLAALWLILSEVIHRLKSYWGHSSRRDGEELELGVASAVPIHELFSEIDAHLMRRKKLYELQAQLVQRATQFRAVQRRLLTKFKDKTPTPLTNLDNLLEGTYKQILQITDIINDSVRGLEEDGCILSCVVQVILELVRLQTKMTDHEFSLLIASVSPVVQCGMDQGWEETTDSSVTFLLKSVLGRGSRDAAIAPELTMPHDTIKLKKHLGILFEKILKAGAQLNISAPTTNNIDTTEDTHSGDEGEITDVVSSEDIKSKQSKPHDPTSVPLGSRLGEDRARSARVRSARLMSARRIIEERSEDNEAESSYPDSGKDSTEVLVSPNEEEDTRSRDLESSPPHIVDTSAISNSENDDALPDHDENDGDGLSDPDDEDAFNAEVEEMEEKAEDEESEVLNPSEVKNEIDGSLHAKPDVFSGDIEKLKKQTSKDNMIESPADVLVDGDLDDLW
ncbi:protein PTHB1 [Palaemon carinicauda]|uniref:protein PTHB1 n=1 Tax=Palaemon carinicauda TaxID=392227 RepID=UPI0035B68E80